LECLKSILYFSLFDHPLRKEELYRFCRVEKLSIIDDELDFLLSEGVISLRDEHYLHNTNLKSIKRKNLGKQKATAITPKARKRARLIYKFPFVRGVAFSGSFSKDYFDDNSDIDFFIITSSSRLWIARTALVLFRKIFLLNSRKYFCVNYFVSEEGLKIAERDRFTATELITLKPVCGFAYFDKFYKANSWAFDFFPHSNPPQLTKTTFSEKRPLLTKVTEKIFSGNFGDKVDGFLRGLFQKKWQTKFADMDKDAFNKAVKATKTASKCHPMNYQKKIDDRLNENYKKVVQEYGLELKEEGNA